MNRKALSLPILLSLVVGNMIGTGIYVLPASLAPYGSLSLVAWLYTAVGAMLMALVFARLNKRHPKTGGPYVYCKEAFGHFAGFVVAYLYWIENMVSVAAVAIASTGYLGFIYDALNANQHSYNRYIALLVELTFVWGFTIVNIIGIHAAGIVQVFLTIIKIIPLIIIPIVGFFYIDVGQVFTVSSFDTSNLSAVGSAATLTFWAFVGLEVATVPAENTKGSKDITRATIFGPLMVGIIYLFSTFTLMGLMNPALLAKSQFPFADAATHLFGSYAAMFVVICAVFSGLGTLNSCVLVQGQVLFAAARDKLSPKYFAKLSKGDAPLRAQLFSSTLVSICLIVTVNPSLLQQFETVTLLAVLVTLSAYFAAMLAELKFLLQSKKSIGRIMMSQTFIVTLLAACYAAWTMSNFTYAFHLAFLAIIAICLPIYYFTVRHYA